MQLIFLPANSSPPIKIIITIQADGYLIPLSFLNIQNVNLRKQWFLRLFSLLNDAKKRFHFFKLHVKNTKNIHNIVIYYSI